MAFSSVKRTYSIDSTNFFHQKKSKVNLILKWKFRESSIIRPSVHPKMSLDSHAQTKYNSIAVGSSQWLSWHRVKAYNNNNIYLKNYHQCFCTFFQWRCDVIALSSWSWIDKVDVTASGCEQDGCEWWKEQNAFEKILTDSDSVWNGP